MRRSLTLAGLTVATLVASIAGASARGSSRSGSELKACGMVSNGRDPASTMPVADEPRVNAGLGSGGRGVPPIAGRQHGRGLGR